MEVSASELRKQRLDRLYDDCRNQVLSQLIGPFGLSVAMFEDKNGGNVTTVHNFERDNADYVATDDDRIRHEHSKKEYSKKTRAEYEVKTEGAAERAGPGETWDEKRQRHIDMGVDRYTGEAIGRGADGQTMKGDVPVSMDLDHRISISEVHRTPKNHLALGNVVTNKDGERVFDASAMAAMVNDDANLALTNKSLNCSKGDEDLQAWATKKQAQAEEAGQDPAFDPAAIEKIHNDAQAHLNSTVGNALRKKQVHELLETGKQQAAKMALRQSMGVLLTELVQSLFTEAKDLIARGVEFGAEFLKEIGARLLRVAENVIRKLPAAGAALIEGGVSGFVSNLITFLLNNFVSTAKRFVTVIREGLIGLFRALKMILFPPKHMTADEALQAGLKLLGAAVITGLGTIIGESVANFLVTVPFLGSIAQVVAPALMGILTGLLSALLAYQIDRMFDRRRMDEQMLDAMLADAKARSLFADQLVEQVAQSVQLLELNVQSIASYTATGIHYTEAAANADETLGSIERANQAAGAFIRDVEVALPKMADDHDVVAAFLQNRVQEA
jgi:hypothetical protein